MKSIPRLLRSRTLFIVSGFLALAIAAPLSLQAEAESFVVKDRVQTNVNGLGWIAGTIVELGNGDQEGKVKVHADDYPDDFWVRATMKSAIRKFANEKPEAATAARAKAALGRFSRRACEANIGCHQASDFITLMRAYEFARESRFNFDRCRGHGINAQGEAAEAMKISKAQLSDVIRQKKGVSANLAQRVQFCFGIPGSLLIRLQAQFDFQNAYRAKNGDLKMEVRTIA